VVPVKLYWKDSRRMMPSLPHAGHNAPPPPATVIAPVPVIIGATRRMPPPDPNPRIPCWLESVFPPFAVIVPVTEMDTELAIKIAHPLRRRRSHPHLEPSALCAGPEL
jgi:hypothetical protein